MTGMLDGKVVVVTGAGGGIGREIAIMMARRRRQGDHQRCRRLADRRGPVRTPAQQTQAIIEQRGGQAEISTDCVPNGDQRRRSSRRRWIISAASTPW